eukprot:SAG31_NODE_17386_length_672_cov_1.881326_1_plen_103_part_00
MGITVGRAVTAAGLSDTVRVLSRILDRICLLFQKNKLSALRPRGRRRADTTGSYIVPVDRLDPGSALGAWPHGSAAGGLQVLELNLNYLLVAGPTRYLNLGT